MFNFALRRLPSVVRQGARRGARHVTSGLSPLSLIPACMPAFVPALVPAVIPSLAHADSTTADVTLSPVAISAKAPAAPRAVDPNMPASVETVTPEQFDNWNVVNTEDVLK